MNKFLHVGCGPNQKRHTTPAFATSEWEEVRFDIDKAANPDIVGDVLDLGMIKPDSFEAIYSSHNIEHVSSYQVPIMLKEFLRVLKQDGYFVVTCPNLLPVARLIAEDKLTEPIYVSPMGPISPLDILYGHGKSIKEGNEFMAHKTGFTPKSLRAILLGAGFKNVGVLARNKKLDIWAIATKGKLDDSEAMADLMKQHFPLHPSAKIKG